MLRLTVLVATLVAVWGAPQTDVQYSPGGRIVGGKDTTIEEHPFSVSILFLGSHNCGGALISSTWVVSAAHCFINVPIFFVVRVGSTFRTTGGQNVELKRIVSHPQYDSGTLNYDIAVVELANPVTHPVPQAIGLAAEDTEAGTPALVTGWGRTSESGSLSNVLQVVEVPIIDHATCVDAYEDFVIPVTNTMICAGLLGVGGKDACQGDSGGPLVSNGVLIGVVSWGDGCARADSPGVYASVSYFRDWIRQITGI